MSTDQYVPFIGEARKPRINKKKIALAAVAVFAVVGVVAAVAYTSATPKSQASTSLAAAPDMSAIYAKAGALMDHEYEFLFNSFASEHEKNYATAEERLTRFLIFKQNLDYIRKHNSENHGYELAVNQFADMTREEFKQAYLGLPAVRPFKTLPADATYTAPADLPSEVDWRQKNVVTPVKNQQQCGSCWAFSTTGSVEGAVALKTGKLVSLSEQQLVDCAGKYDNQGCNGGLMDHAFKYIIEGSHGLMSESDYAYTARDGKCKFDSKKVAATITDFKDVAKSDEDALLAAVAQQPVSVAIEADQSGFQYYKSGVFDGACGTDLDHGVLLVGYGTENGKNYWLVKNSWGPKWGDEGYIKLVRKGGKTDGQCGIALAASYPIA